MNNRYIGKNEIPRWMMQQTPSIGESNSRQIKMVSPEDLQAQSAMYGQVSRDMFQLSDQISRNMSSFSCLSVLIKHNLHDTSKDSLS
jgi:hypothetical protein